MVRIFTLDLHTHIAEQKVDAEKYWKRAREAGLDGTAITEHTNLEPEKAYIRLAEKKPEGMLLIPGMEMNSEFGHVLAYAADDRIYDFYELQEEGVKIEKILKVAADNNFLVSISHPWGFNYDSMGYIYGMYEIEDLVVNENLGVEVYNGMIGHLSNFIYDSGWIKRPRNFLDFLERNRVARRVWLNKLTGRIKRSVDRQSLDIVQRCANAVELGDKARFVTAGSDAHSADRVGTGIIKIKSPEEEVDNRRFLEMLQRKENVIWSGPMVKEVRKGVYEKVDDPLRRKEIIQGLGYATRKVSLRKEISARIRKKLRITKRWKKVK